LTLLLHRSPSVSKIGQAFRALHAAEPALICRAPGRVNMIGEHTDYNDGFVMPAAIERYTWAAIGPRRDSVLHVTSDSVHESVELNLEELQGPPRGHWSDYVRGVAALLQRAGHKLGGANLVIQSDVPLGAGLSSSASLEIATAIALASLNGIEFTRSSMIMLCQKAEHEFAGTKCGIMDQFASAYAEEGRLILLDCRSMEHSLVPVPLGATIVIVNTRVRHELAAGEYNQRRSDCDTGVRLLAKLMPTIRTLRDVALSDLELHKELLSESVYRRCRHVVTENSRVLRAATALSESNLSTFGELMYASHESLRSDFEVSCPELNFLVETAASLPGVYGARMTGGGFGGCTVNLVQRDAVWAFNLAMEERYTRETGFPPFIYTCSAAQGADIVWKNGHDPSNL